MVNSPNRFRIVVGFDFSSQAMLALDRAIWLASGFASADLHVAAGLGSTGTNPDFPRFEKGAAGQDDIRERLTGVVAERVSLLKPTSLRTFIHAWPTPGEKMILTIAADVGADLIIVGSHSKRGLARVVLGSVSEKIVREASCPVMVMRETSWHEPSSEIEPPCPRCTVVRAESDGERWWCEFHDHAPPYASPLRSHSQHNPEQARRLAWPMI